MSGLKYYRTSEIARAVGVHPNTVRLYEDWGLLQHIPRGTNSYRLYTVAHLEQMRLARIVLKNFVERNIRKRARSIIKTAAEGNLKLALEEAYNYLDHIRNERAKAEGALTILQRWINKRDESDAETISLRMRDAARLLSVSIDALRNWERNGLLEVPRSRENGYRLYGQKEINRAKVIRTLRMANYSMMSILRMLKTIDTNENVDIYRIVSTNYPDEDMVYVTDRLILSLAEIEKDANEIILQIQKMLGK
jgi:DNA-binding transcriptional MerR regulator